MSSLPSSTSSDSSDSSRHSLAVSSSPATSDHDSHQPQQQQQREREREPRQLDNIMISNAMDTGIDGIKNKQPSESTPHAPRFDVDENCRPDHSSTAASTTASSRSSSWQAPTLLLQALQRDWSHKHSVQDCLHGKAWPCILVQRVLQQQSQHRTDTMTLYISHCALLEHCLGSLKLTSTQAPMLPIRECLARLAMVDRFVQLLLELMRRIQQPITKPDGQDGHDDSGNQHEPNAPQHDADKLCNMVMQILAGSISVVTALLELAQSQQQQSANGGSSPSCCSIDVWTTPLDDLQTDLAMSSATLASFWLATILRWHRYVATTPSLLSPLYKGLERLAAALVRQVGSLPNHTIQYAIQAVLLHLQEGWLLAWTTLVDNVTSPSSPQQRTAQQQPVQVDVLVKILAFLVSRLTTWMAVAARDRGMLTRSPIWRRACQVLAVLRGSHLVLEATNVLRQQQQHDHQHPPQHVDHYQWFQIKLEKVLTAAMVHQKSHIPQDGSLLLSDVDPYQIHGLKGWIHRHREFVSSNNQAGTEESNENDNDCDDDDWLEACPGVARSLACQAKFVGQWKWLLEVLQHAFINFRTQTWTPQETQILLQICERLVLDQIPSCETVLKWIAIRGGGTTTSVSPTNGSSLISSSAEPTAGLLEMMHTTICVIGSVLHACATVVPCLAGSVHPGRARFHAWLVQWLNASVDHGDGLMSATARRFHPLSRELSLTILSWHMLACDKHDNLAAATTSSGSTAQQHYSSGCLQQFLVHLLFDGRTRLGLRRNIAALLRRVQAMRESLSATTDQTHLDRCIQEAYDQACCRYRREQGNQSSSSSSSRKRRSSCQSCITAATKGLTWEDWQVINVVVSYTDITLRTTVSPQQTAALGWTKYLSTKSNRMPRHLLSQLVVSSSALDLKALLELMERLVQVEESTSTVAHKAEIRQALLGCLIRTLRHSHHSPSHLLHDHQVKPLACFLQHCLDVSRFLLARTDLQTTTSASRIMVAIALPFQVAHGLVQVSKALSPTCPKPSLACLAHIFHTLLSSVHWPLRAFTMTQLVEFASSIPACHQTMLPSCVPIVTQKLLQCRLQGRVWRSPTNDNNNIYSINADWQHEMLQSWPLPPQQQQPDRQNDATTAVLFAMTSSDLMLAVGSICVNMSTCNGRSAIVIFPPGPEPYQDMLHLLNVTAQTQTTLTSGYDDEDNQTNYSEHHHPHAQLPPTIRILRRVVPSVNGSCHLTLEEIDFPSSL